MKEINRTTKNEGLKYNFKRTAFLAIGISLVQNRAIVWAILNGDFSDINILILVTVLLIIGAILGEYLFGRWLQEKFLKSIDRILNKNDNAN